MLQDPVKFRVAHIEDLYRIKLWITKHGSDQTFNARLWYLAVFDTWCYKHISVFQESTEVWHPVQILSVPTLWQEKK